MASNEGFLESYMAEIDRINSTYLSDLSKGLDGIVEAAGIQADVYLGNPVNIFRRVIAETVLPPAEGPEIRYTLPAIRYDRPAELLGGRSTYPREIGFKEGLRRAEEVKGCFFEFCRPTWDPNSPPIRNLFYVYDVEKAEMPNPTVHYISVDPKARFYGQPMQMYATDIGFRPCPYGNHSYVSLRREMGKIKLPDYPTDIKDLAANVTVIEPGKGLEYLARAIAFGSQDKKAA